MRKLIIGLLGSVATLSLACAQEPVLKVDPLLMAEGAEVWSIIGNATNPVWPGWNASNTPLLFYFPKKQDVLVNHPNPPAGFREYKGPIPFPGGKIYVRDGETITDLDGQNTSLEVNNVLTLVVADTLSTRRQWLQNIAGSAQGGAKDIDDLIDHSLIQSPYDVMATIAHEAFHVYQGQRAPNKGGDEMSLAQYPALSVQNNVETAIEADLLKEALSAKSPVEVRQAAVKWLAVRTDRRSKLPTAVSDYEDGTEFNEGLAKYVEYRLFETMQGKKPSPIMWWIEDFRGFADLAPERANLIAQMSKMMTGEAIVNNDLYGASPVRMRLYFSGMGVAALLDRLGANWHDRIFGNKESLTGLASKEIHANPEELEAALKAVKSSERYSALTVIKSKLAEDGAAYNAKCISEMESSPAKVIIDYSAIANPKIGLAYTPFGILNVDADRTFFRLVPIAGRVGGLRFEEDSARNVLQDRAKKQFVLTLTAKPGNLKLPDGPGAIQKLTLPGVTLSGGSGTIQADGDTITVRLTGA